jgi:arylsulfatase
LVTVLVSCAPSPDAPRPPNFVVVLSDDQGYGDLGSYGATDIRTPRLDEMAAQGTRYTSFYAHTVCGPSRAALLTGSYARRADLSPTWSLHADETTLAEVLRPRGYATACIGKWDLSERLIVPARLPLGQGFDYFFGTLGSNDYGLIPLMRNLESLGAETDPARVIAHMGKVTALYTDEAIAFMERHVESPFFLYLAYNMPHGPVGASEAFQGKSGRGLYGDAIEEMDWHVGRLLDAVRRLGLERDTVVVFASDNGPRIAARQAVRALGGQTGPLRGGKGSAWEGGYRVPAIWWGPGRIPAGRASDALLTTLDILPTFAAMAGASLPQDRVLDGVDQTALVTGASEESARETFFYYPRDRLEAVRSGPWKLLLPRGKPRWRWAPDQAPIDAPRLYNLRTDPGETRDLATAHPAVLRRLLALADRVRADLGEDEDPGTGRRRFGGPPPQGKPQSLH